MAVTEQPKSSLHTAVNEGLSFGGRPRIIDGISFQGTGLTAGQRITVRDTSTPGTGTILADYVTQTTIDAADLSPKGPKQCLGVSIDNNTVAGTWAVAVSYK